MKLSPRCLYHFTPFTFKSGKQRDKYFIVVKDFKGELIIGVLPTSKNQFPNFLNATKGCYHSLEACFSGYIIPPAIKVTECETFSFRTNTYVYPKNVDLWQPDSFMNMLSQGSMVELIGTMKNELYDDIVQCLKESKYLANKIKRKL